MMTNFEKYTDQQLDEIYYSTIGYRPIAEGELRENVIEILTGYEQECAPVIIPEF
jgi:hypothetical protein